MALAGKRAAGSAPKTMLGGRPAPHTRVQRVEVEVVRRPVAPLSGGGARKLAVAGAVRAGAPIVDAVLDAHAGRVVEAEQLALVHRLVRVLLDVLPRRRSLVACESTWTAEVHPHTGSRRHHCSSSPSSRDERRRIRQSGEPRPRDPGKSTCPGACKPRRRRVASDPSRRRRRRTRPCSRLSHRGCSKRHLSTCRYRRRRRCCSRLNRTATTPCRRRRGHAETASVQQSPPSQLHASVLVSSSQIPSPTRAGSPTHRSSAVAVR